MLRENILLDSIDNKRLSESLQRYREILLTLVPVNEGNKELHKAYKLTKQIEALDKQNIRKFFSLMSKEEDQAKRLIQTFNILEQTGILDSTNNE